MLTSFSFCTSNNEVYASKYILWQVLTASSPLVAKRVRHCTSKRSGTQVKARLFNTPDSYVFLVVQT